MTKRYEVTHAAHYIGGRLVMPGQGADSIVTLPEGVTPGRWLVEVVALQPAVAGNQASADPVPGPYKAKHIAGGAYAVVDADGNEIGERFLKDGADAGKAKAAAMAKADELNLAHSAANDDPPPGGASGQLPDA